VAGRTWICAAVAAFACALTVAPAASANPPPAPELGGVTPLGGDVVRMHFKYGPINVAPGQNLILIGPVTIEKPQYDGYITRIKPDLVRGDGSVPNVDVIHLHHGVWLSSHGSDATTGGGAERFFASGEEKTIFKIPDGYGYPVRRNDVWLLNYMVHNQTPVQDEVWITYDVDFIPADSERGRRTKPVYPVWMDVVNGSAYPVFDVHRAEGSNGKWTFPTDARDPYRGRPLNEWTVPRDMTLLVGAGHVHPGGLYTDLDVLRKPVDTTAAHERLRRRYARAHRRFHRRLRRSRIRGRARIRAHRRYHRSLARRLAAGDKRLRLEEKGVARAFRSEAKYFDPNGPVSWDLAMTATDSDWRLALKKGDKLRVSATYETERASWYESMGIMIFYATNGRHGADPFTDAIDTTGKPTHGHLAESGNYGGKGQGTADPRKLPDGASNGNHVDIAAFQYLPGNQGLAGSLGNPPLVEQGQPLRFENQDWGAQVFHTVTACKAPCTASTGISYPIADGPVDFDSAELGYGPDGLTPASNRTRWNTPRDLTPGTYTYFCRIHPYMRGSFRVKKSGS
jgi:plastocyanin